MLATEDAHLPPVVPGLHHHVHVVLNVGALGVALDKETIILILECLRFTPAAHKSQNLFSEIQDPAVACLGTRDVPPQCSTQPVGSRRRR